MRTLLFLLLLPCSLWAAEPAKPTAEQVDFFEKKVRPLLLENCTKCHGEKKSQAGLRLDTLEGLTKGGDAGPVVVPGQPEKSKLILAVRRVKNDEAMPPDNPLKPEDVKTLEAWVQTGAYFAPSTKANTVVDAKKHWAFQPMKEQPVPASKSSNPIDGFISAKLSDKALSLSPQADRRTLGRRLFFDLLGLPPTAEELDAFDKDTSPNATEQLIDRLLASPHYGERWGRHWLDVARYADTKGYVFTEDLNYPYAYTYRDYVVRSINNDVPYDQFIREQIAADKLNSPDKSILAAMGFLTVGRRFSNNIHDITDDRIDVVTRGLMGLSVTCARCHDHKFDPIPTADYYGIYGVFSSSNEPKDLPMIGDKAASAKYTTDLAKLEKVVADEREKINAGKRRDFAVVAGGFAGIANVEKAKLNQGERELLRKKQNEVDKFKAKSPDAPPHAMVMVDNAKAGDHVVFLRGNPGNPGPVAPRKMPGVVATANAEKFKDGSGRLELAKGIASKDNPLTARVLVNRVWMWHFGQGLVRTPSDFGVRSEAPTHPELLDWLALRFVNEDGWSLKKLHKRILLSAVYQQSSKVSDTARGVDPENRLLSHQNLTRHDCEALRDSALAVSGQLDRTNAGRSVNLFKPPFSLRRSVYGSVDRQNLPGTFRAFDFASPEQHTPQRFQTTVPQQSLFLMNSPFMAQAVKATVNRVEMTKAEGDEKKLTALYRVVLSRNPTSAEREVALQFLLRPQGEMPTTTQFSAWEQLAQVLLLSNEFCFVD